MRGYMKSYTMRSGSMLPLPGSMLLLRESSPPHTFSVAEEEPARRFSSSPRPYTI